MKGGRASEWGGCRSGRCGRTDSAEPPTVDQRQGPLGKKLFRAVCFGGRSAERNASGLAKTRNPGAPLPKKTPPGPWRFGSLRRRRLETKRTASFVEFRNQRRCNGTSTQASSLDRNRARPRQAHGNLHAWFYSKYPLLFFLLSLDYINLTAERHFQTRLLRQDATWCLGCLRPRCFPSRSSAASAVFIQFYLYMQHDVPLPNF